MGMDIMKNESKDNAGFTLLELMLVFAVLVLLASIGTGSYFSYLKSTELDAGAKEIGQALKSARDKAMTGQSDKNWGVRFANGTSDFYEIFSTANLAYESSVAETGYLKSGISFQNPTEGNNLDVIFTKISATTTAATTTISSSFGGSKDVTVTAVGRIN